MAEEFQLSDIGSRSNNRKNLKKNINDFFDKMGQQFSTVKVPKMIFHRYKNSMSNDDLSQSQIIEDRSIFLKEIKYISNHFDISEKILGRGKFGVTRIAINKQTKEKYACKTISKDKLQDEKEIAMLQNEVSIMHVLRGHENIIEICDVYEDKENIHIIMELCTGGELFDSIVEKGTFPEYDASNILRSMLKVIAHCHDHYIIHGDLKPENFLISHKGPGAKLKAIDFGISQFTKEDELLTELVGSVYYMAPEVIKKSYSFESDIWSAGVILYILLCGEPPFQGNTNMETFRAILEWDLEFAGDIWDNISNAAKNCIKKMLERNPKKRATARELLEDPWLIETGLAPKQSLNNALLEKMKKFSRFNKLKKVAIKLIAENLPLKETEGLRRIFHQIDTDNSGTITLKELKAAMVKKNQNVREFELYKIIQTIDLTKKGELNYEEFLAANLQIRKLDSDENVLHAFESLDTDNNGYISRDEIRNALKTQDLTEKEIDNILFEVDINQDGRIDFQEFRAMIHSNN